MDAAGKIVALGVACLLSACATVEEGPAVGQAPADDWSLANFAAWSPETPDYLLYPGDQIDIVVPSAPELSRTVTVGPDGRFNFPYVGAVMAANRTAPEVTQSLSAALAGSLRRPYVEVSPIAFGSQQILVMGEVATPGMYELRGPMGALEAVAIAGGFTATADLRRVSIIRRAPDGRPMRRDVNLRATLRGAGGGDYDVLARYDIVYVPRSGLAGAGAFMQQLSDLVPFNIGFSYALNDDDDFNSFVSSQ